MSKQALKFIALSGTSGVTENLYVYEYGNDMIIVDCGVGFPDPEMYGVDLVIPDFTYIRQNAKKLRGIVITHGHEDHLGAVPFLMRDVKVPVYASRLTAGFLEDKLVDYKIKDFKIHVFDPDRDALTLGVFKVTPFLVSHSVPDACGLAIDTPEGKLFHVPDYKFDWTPTSGKPFDVAKAATLASGGVLALASDALGSMSPGHTESEAFIEDRIESIVKNATGQVYFTTISSNISRMQQALNVAMRNGRKACFVGRSVDRKAEIARRLGYLTYPRDLVVNIKQARNYDKDHIMYIISGCYGQPGSALYRVALGEHQQLSLEEADTVIFSGDPAPPGSKAKVDFLVDRLFEMNVDVHYYDMQEDLHVSGHGSQEDIKFLFGLIKPKYFIPIGGTVRHMRGYRDLAVNMGAKPSSVLELPAGGVVEYKEGRASQLKPIPVRDVLVDGIDVGGVGNAVLRDRQILAEEGFVIVILHMDKTNGRLTENPELVSRGFVFEKKHKGFLENASKELKKRLDERKVSKAQIIRDESVNFLEKTFLAKTGRRPMIIPVIVEI